MPALTAAIVTASASILIAIMAYWLNHRGELVRAKNKAELDRIDAQLKNLYGPLLVLASSNELSWKEFRRRYLPERQGRHPSDILSDEQEMRWRRWVTTVFMPTARRVRDVIIDHGDLIIENEMPEVVLNFCAHVSSYEVLIIEWESTGQPDEVLVHHPGEDFVTYVRESHEWLKDAQSRALLRRG